jgi:UDP-MurNAc hydroxylase
MKVRYLKSSTVVVETKGVKILTDPWLTDGEYYGSWFHYPMFNFDENFFTDIDYIYVSHIHMDHFSKATFKLLKKSIPVIIHSYESKFLKLNIERMGFTVIELLHNERTHLKNGVYINILAADNCNPELCQKFMGCGKMESTYGSTQIDSLCVIDDGEFSILNTNDCPFELASNTLPNILNQYSKIDFLMVGYAGAGPFPQCFVLPEQEKKSLAKRKEIQFLNQGLNYINTIKPDYVMPFAGTYVLGGKLFSLQEFRGVPEIEDAAIFFKENSDAEVILLNSYEWFDLAKVEFSKKYSPQDLKEKELYIKNVLSLKYLDYELEDKPTIDELIPLLENSYKRFENKRKEIAFYSDTVVLLKVGSENFYMITFNGKGAKLILKEHITNFEKYVVYDLDIRLLKWILLGPKYAHWNNAEIGSHILFERNPNIFERGLYHSMCYFHN